VKKLELTLAYFLKDYQVLLALRKKKGFAQGIYNGVGGKLENNETHEGAMIRECIEEVGLEPTEYKYAGKITFYQPMNGEKVAATVHIYLCTSWQGNLTESNEVKPEWFELNHLPYHKMMEDDKYWLPLILEGKKIEAVFELDENLQTINYQIQKSI